jgi:hypothetical protein
MWKIMISIVALIAGLIAGFAVRLFNRDLIINKHLCTVILNIE